GYSEAVSSDVDMFCTGPHSVKINGGSPEFLTNVNFDPDGNSPILMCRMSSTVNPGDTVTYTCPDNSIECVAGSIAGVTDVPIANHTQSTTGPLTPDTVTLKVGWNLLNSGIIPRMSNLFLNQSPLPFADATPGTSTGYPQSKVATYNF